MPQARIGLDNPAFAGRIRITHARRSTYERRAVVSSPRLIADVRANAKPAPSKPKPLAQTHKQAAIHRSRPAGVPSRQARSLVLRRQLVASKKALRRRGRRHFGFKSVALTSLATMLFVFGVGVGIVQLTTNQKVKAQVQTIAAAQQDAPETNGVSSEQKPGNTSTYRVSPTAPRVLTIASIGVDARVVRLGVTANNELKAPANIFDAGWYEGSAHPGEQGAVLLDGHVHGPSQPGVFSKLKKMKAGDAIAIERGDGKKFTYHVAKTQSYDVDKVDMGAAFNSATPGKPGLNIITCDGAFDDNGHYNKRLIVFAVQD